MLTELLVDDVKKLLCEITRARACVLLLPSPKWICAESGVVIKYTSLRDPAATLGSNIESFIWFLYVLVGFSH